MGSLVDERMYGNAKKIFIGDQKLLGLEMNDTQVIETLKDLSGLFRWV